MPSGDKVKEELWKLCFPDSPVDPQSTLQLVYEAACLRDYAGTKALLTQMLSVDGNTIPDWYRFYFKLPWLKCYTLNIDDLANRVGQGGWMQRKIESLSAIGNVVANTDSDRDTLRVVHLNGVLAGLPKDVTFSLTQYAERMAYGDAVYAVLVAELLSYPFVLSGQS